MNSTFYSNGKLLLSGEYVVLDNALAFALPTKFGQSMEVNRIDEPYLSWTAYDQDNTIWMNETIAIAAILSGEAIEGSTYLKGLVDVLRVAHTQNNSVLSIAGGYKVVCKLSFPRLWGLGTSSTWITNIAQWFNSNPYFLLANSFGGSGYDIACAQSNSAIYYKREDRYNPIAEEFLFAPNFTDQLYFVYLNQKMDSKEGIRRYREKRGVIEKEIQRISAISLALANCQSLASFQDLLQEHEDIISSIIKEIPIKERLFADFEGAIKSLGAWGGDFILVACEKNPKAYFEAKGYPVILTYKDMIL